MQGEEAAALAARHVSFHHPGSPRLFEDFSLAIARAEFLGLIGPNGSGKTTLLRLLSGTLNPDAGEVRLDGRPARSISSRERARLIAVVPQETRILFDFSVLEIVLMGRAARLGFFGLERPGDFAAARAALSEVDLAAAEGKRLSQLSSGERQRAHIARALAQEPRLLLLDEPTAYLDLKHRLQIYEILKRLNRSQRLTVVVVSHDLNLAARYGSRLVLLDHGRLVADGPPASVITPDLIRRVYETEAIVTLDPASGTPTLIPIAPL